MHKITLWFRWLIFAAVLLLMLIVSVEFIASNKELLSVSFLGYQAPEGSLSSYLLLAFVIGGALGVFSASLVVSRLWMSNKSLNRKLVRRQTELKNLHESVIKGMD